MPVLEDSRIAELLSPYDANIPEGLVSHLSIYLDLLVRWNARTNLTSIRSPEEMVQRHFGESLFAARHLGLKQPENLLDLGSGAGFPGLPIALAHPQIQVILAESQNKKATFLREALRTLDVSNAEVWAARVETMPEERRFHTVTLRAVDDMEQALKVAAPRARHQILVLTTHSVQPPDGFMEEERIPLPGSKLGVLVRLLNS
jgi:16S rRNA (guanine527-N7)-methyltransferase